MNVRMATHDLLADQRRSGWTSFPGAEPSRGAAAKRGDVERMQAAAQEFEASLIHSWWKSMQESFGSDESVVMTGDSGVLQDLSTQAMATAMAAAGGIGFSSLILKHLRQDSPEPTDPTTDPALVNTIPRPD